MMFDNALILKVGLGLILFIVLNNFAGRLINPPVEVDHKGYYEEVMKNERLIIQRDSALNIIETYETKINELKTNYNQIDSIVAGYDSTAIDSFWTNYLSR